MSGPALAAADWGTSRFRLWLLDPEGRVLAERRSDEGLAEAGAAGFASVLETHLEALGAAADLPVLVCGMAGSRQGWVEAPYLPVPVALADIPRAAVPVPDARRKVRILPGLSQGEPPDVMRGEETQLLGTGLADGTVCLPGTHSKWAVLAGGRVTRFATFMTGELFDLLAHRSILRHGLGTPAGGPAFAEGVAAALAAPETVLTRLFGLRAAGLLGAAAPDAAASRLSGLLVGLELAGARAAFGATGPVALVASGPLAALYGQALALAGFSALPEDAEAAVRAGLLGAARPAFGQAA